MATNEKKVSPAEKAVNKAEGRARIALAGALAAWVPLRVAQAAMRQEPDGDQHVAAASELLELLTGVAS